MKTICTLAEHTAGIGATRVAYVLASLGAAHDLLDLLEAKNRMAPWGGFDSKVGTA